MTRLTLWGVTVLVALFVAPAVANDDATVLKVSLFRYVPNPKGIEAVVEKRWHERHPDVKVEFVKWDGYKEDPPSNLDVFEFDSIMLEYFVRNNFVSPLRLDEIQGRDDFYEFAFRGGMVDGVCYAVPRIACTPLLFFRKGDASVQNASSISDLHAALGDNPCLDVKPLKNHGLMIDLSGGTTCGCFYLDAVADKLKSYSV